MGEAFRDGWRLLMQQNVRFTTSAAAAERAHVSRHSFSKKQEAGEKLESPGVHIDGAALIPCSYFPALCISCFWVTAHDPSAARSRSRLAPTPRPVAAKQRRSFTYSKVLLSFVSKSTQRLPFLALSGRRIEGPQPWDRRKSWERDAWISTTTLPRNKGAWLSCRGAASQFNVALRAHLASRRCRMGVHALMG